MGIREWVGVIVGIAVIGGAFEIGRRFERVDWLESERTALETRNESIREAQRALNSALVRAQVQDQRNAALARKMRSAQALATGRHCLSDIVVARLRGEPDIGVPQDSGGAPGRPGTGADDRAVIDVINRLTEYANECRKRINTAETAARGAGILEE